MLPGMGMGPPGQPPPTKIGFNTYAMWVLCFIVVGVCYKLEQYDKPPQKEALPNGVDRVLPSGAYLMSAPPRRARVWPAHEPCSELMPARAQRVAASAAARARSATWLSPMLICGHGRVRACVHRGWLHQATMMAHARRLGARRAGF